MRTVLSSAASIALVACSHAPPLPDPAPIAPPPAAVQVTTEAPPTPQPSAMPAPAPQPPLAQASIYFDYDSDDLLPDTRAQLQAFADEAQKHPDQRIRIEGNCDERGTEEYNLALGQRRAAAAKKYLENLGVSAERIDTISYGKERPRAPGHDEASWKENRRDDLVPAAGAPGALSQSSR